MKVHHFQDIEAQEAPYMDGVTVRWVINEEMGAPHFAMRVFDVEPGCTSAFHDHWWEHEVFVLAGAGSVTWVEDGRDRQEPLREGSVVFVPGGLKHQFINDGGDVLRFICCVPHKWLEGVAEEYKEMQDL